MDNDSDDLTIKIIDWGCAQTIKTTKQSNQADGTAYYIAICDNNKKKSNA